MSSRAGLTCESRPGSATLVSAWGAAAMSAGLGHGLGERTMRRNSIRNWSLPQPSSSETLANEEQWLMAPRNEKGGLLMVPEWLLRTREVYVLIGYIAF